MQVATTLSLRDGSSDNDQSSDNFMTRSLYILCVYYKAVRLNTLTFNLFFL